MKFLQPRQNSKFRNNFNEDDFRQNSSRRNYTENRERNAINAIQNEVNYPRNKVNDENDILCFNCNKYGHISMTCPELRKTRFLKFFL